MPGFGMNDYMERMNGMAGLAKTAPFLIVEKGEPYRKGEIVSVPEGACLLGRDWQDHHPDIGFASFYISRRQAILWREKGKTVLKTHPEAKSKAAVNGKVLSPGEGRELRHGDRISLGNDTVLLIFCSGIEPGETWTAASITDHSPLFLDEAKHEVFLNGENLKLTGKRYELFRLLYQNRGRAVSDDEIRQAVWPERESGPDGVPLVNDEEIATLIRFLRERLGEYAYLLETVRSYGYRLELET
ncbi:MAG: winged helix-turn-helix domain-containing protein [Firmicutes bacterium]|nr:winged helix-turn-helix domain-containing protein [Bacillota bacterium]